MSDTPVNGTVAPGYEDVVRVFTRSFEHGEVGAGVCAYADGRKVVDLWGGWADEAKTRPWERDTIACTYSAVKGMTATCAHRLIERGLLELDEPVATYWPEFAQAGKEKITVRMVLSHQSGLPWANAPFPIEKRFDWDTMTDALARSTPMWEPGTKAAYHGGSFGFLVGEMLRRIDGRSLTQYFKDEIAGPVAADYLIAVGDEEARCAEMVGSKDDAGPANTPQWHAAGDGAATAFGTAEGLARVYAALARGGELDGVRVLRPETIDAAVQEQVPSAGVNNYEEMGPVGLGYQLLWKMFPAVEYTGMFGHTGMGGSVGLADPFNKVGFGWVMNKLHVGAVYHVQAAVYRALAALRDG